jgi:peptide methionine sulfoxide reductase MsrB|tara:strand:+ start:302 stop:1033 length:732 start_codon:yes stop_codon:yes gene_type:complete
VTSLFYVVFAQEEIFSEKEMAALRSIFTSNALRMGNAPSSSHSSSSSRKRSLTTKAGIIEWANGLNNNNNNNNKEDSDGCKGADAPEGSKFPIYCDESIMCKKAHGTSDSPVQKDLRWNCDYETADRICNFNRHYAEYAGYFLSTSFLNEVDRTKETTFYDSVTGKPLFIAPRGRTFGEFEEESKAHGWPSFRDEEVVWENVRCVPGGEAVSTTGTHLGHNLPDKNGNRYCINLVSVAAMPPK